MAVATLAIEDAARRIGESGSTSVAYTRTRFLGGVKAASAGMSARAATAVPNNREKEKRADTRECATRFHKSSQVKARQVSTSFVASAPHAAPTPAGVWLAAPGRLLRSVSRARAGLGGSPATLRSRSLGPGLVRAVVGAQSEQFRAP